MRQPIRLSGEADPYSILNTGQPPAKFYFYQGQLLALDPNPQFHNRGFVNTKLAGGTCTTYGEFGVIGGTNTNKCASYGTLGLSSNQENSQLGAKLVFNWAGGFYACGATKAVSWDIQYE